MFYCAHAIFYFKLLYEEQDSYLIHENVYLIEAADPVSARKHAEKIAKSKEDTSTDGHLELNDKKAAYLFAGLRKIIEVESHPASASTLLAYVDGVEVTYSVFEVDTFDEVLALANQEMVEILYRE